MKWWKKLCAAALALSMPVLASAEAKLVDTQTFARSITLGRASDTYVTREDWRDTLRAMDGTALSESYADISAQEKGLYYEVANENGVNQTGLMDAAGTLLIPMTYSDFTYVGNGWVVNFADASAQGGGDPLLIYRFGKAVSSDEMMHFAAYLLNGRKPYATMGNDAFRSLQSLLCCNDLAKATPKHDMPDVTWYPETEFCYMKNKNGMLLAAKGGFNNESHNHNDVGTFSLYVNTIPVFIDAGVGTYTKQTFGKDRYTIWTMQSNYHNLPMINGVPQKFGQQYKATNTVCNEKKRTFSADIATAYPAEAKVKSWIRSYALDDRKLMITDNYTLNEALAPNQLNFLTWGKVSFPSPGKVRVEVKGQKVELDYPSQFKAELETIKLDDPRLSNVWGKEIYRITLKTEEKKAAGNYKFVIQQVK